MHGFEREGIRITEQGKLSLVPHPKVLGASLTNAYITTDFCEPQLELITPAKEDLQDALRWLDEIQRHVSSNLDDEQIWPFSMPPTLPVDEDDIPLARYGSSLLGIEKTTYRSGIGLRYGRRRLTISGTHYSFSFDGSPLTRELLDRQRHAQTGSDFDPCLHVVRNLFRRLPFFLYLFGASPAFDATFAPGNLARFESHRDSTLYAPYATSLRNSEIGYTSRVQDALAIKYDSIDAHAHDLESATTTPYPAYQEFSKGENLQLNSNILQIENELYRAFRLQQNKRSGQTLVQALRERGVDRIEIRALDIDPELPSGIDPAAAGFMHIAILDCLAGSSPIFSEAEWAELNNTIRSVTWRGRDPNFTVKYDGAQNAFQELGRRFCERLVPLAESLDRDRGSDFYQRSLSKQEAKWIDPRRTPSGKQLTELLDTDKEFVELGLEIASKHRDHYLDRQADPNIEGLLADEAARSLDAFDKLK